jgi:polyhydroxyalkanoate synthesis regulator phasin
MASRKKVTMKKSARRTSSRRRTKQPPVRESLGSAWRSTVAALGNAEVEVERQIRELLDRNKLHRKDAARVLSRVGARIQSERKKAAKDLESTVKRVRAQLRKDRRSLEGMIQDAVQGTLAAFDIPSRKEVANLTRKVERLSRQIDDLPAGRQRAQRKARPRTRRGA